MARIKVDMSKSDRSCQLPTREIPVGETFTVAGEEYVVVKRRSHLRVDEACRGCAFVIGACPATIACSSFDRSDGVNVWFKKKLY